MEGAVEGDYLLLGACATSAHEFGLLNDAASVKNKSGGIIFILLVLFGATDGIAQEAMSPAADVNNVAALMTDGRRLLQQGELDKALQAFEAALKEDETNAEALFYAGTIYIRLNQTQKGIEYIERSVALAPNNVRLRFILAQTYENVSLSSKAMEEYRKIIEMAPNTPEAKESDKHARILLGKKYGEQGKLEQALQIFSDVLAEYPDDVPALINKGLTLSFMGRLDEAQAAWEKALAIQPKNGQIHQNLAALFEKKGDVERSKAEYEQIVQLAPPDSPVAKTAELKLALINGAQFLTKGQLADAQREYEKVLATDPHNSIARFNLAMVYRGLGDMSRAQEMLRSLIDDNPDDLEARSRLGALYLEQGDVKEAVRELEEVVARGKETPQAQQATKLLDNIRAAEQDKQAQELPVDQRIAQYRSRLQQNPDDRQAWLDLGLLYVQLQRHEEAREAFENAVRLDPKDARALAVLGSLYDDTDMTDKAIETYTRALDLESNPTQKQKIEKQLAIVRAKKAYADGNMQDAEERFKAIVSDDNNNYVAHFFLALIYSRGEKLEQAIAEYQEVLRIVPGHLGARLNLAIGYEQTGREEDAVTEYQAVARSGAPGISNTAKTRLQALLKRVGGFSYSLVYALTFDSNTNLSSSNPSQELVSATSGSVSYRRKLRHKRIFWGASFTPTYSIYHQQQFDFIQMDAAPFVAATWRGVDFSASYGYSQTDSVLVEKHYNKSNSFSMDASKRFKMRALLPFLAAKEQRASAPSAWRVNGSYRNFQSDTSPIYDSGAYSIGALLNQGSSSGWSWTGNYTYSNNHNLQTIGNDFAYTSHGISLQLSKSIAPKLSANGSYGFTYSRYTHPDSVTKFTQFRVNKFHSLSAGLNYVVNDNMRLFCNYSYQRNNSNLPTGFILSTEDASTLVGIQSPSLGDYHRYAITAGIGLNF